MCRSVGNTGQHGRLWSSTRTIGRAYGTLTVTSCAGHLGRPGGDRMTDVTRFKAEPTKHARPESLCHGTSLSLGGPTQHTSLGLAGPGFWPGRYWVGSRSSAGQFQAAEP